MNSKMRASAASFIVAVTAVMSVTYAAPATIPEFSIDPSELPKLPAIDIGLPEIKDFANLVQECEINSQRSGRARHVGGAIGGVADGVGLISDGPQINDVLNPQKRDARRGARIGQALGGIASGVGIISGGLAINDRLNPQKREAARGA
jgi:hypothetical protein